MFVGNLTSEVGQFVPSEEGERASSPKILSFVEMKLDRPGGAARRVKTYSRKGIREQKIRGSRKYIFIFFILEVADHRWMKCMKYLSTGAKYILRGNIK